MPKYFISFSYQNNKKSDFYNANCEYESTKKIESIDDITEVEKQIAKEGNFRRRSVKILNYREF